MAIRDLLWACPLCGALDAITGAGGGERCGACGAVYARRRGSVIEARPRVGDAQRRTAAEWSDGLGEPNLESLRARLPPAGKAEPGVLLRAYARLRMAGERRAVRSGARFMGLVEVFGDARAGWLTLDTEALTFGPDGDGTERWPLSSVRAVVASSSTLQARLFDRTVLSIRLADSSLRLWDELLRQAIQARYAERGAGRIVEFQPRIVAVRTGEAGP